MADPFISTPMGPSDFLTSIPGTPAAPVATPAPGVSTEVSWHELEMRWFDRSRQARQRTRYRTRVELIVQGADRVRVLARHDFSDGNLQEAVQAALEEAALLMAPLTPQELLDRARKGYSRTPITQDVLLSCGGRIVAAVLAQGHGNGPVVYRFPALTQR